MPPTNDELIKLRVAADPFVARRNRAKERLKNYPTKEWNFALLGITTPLKEFKVEGIGEFREVTEPPGEIELARVLKQAHLFSAIGRYSHGIRHELAVTTRLDKEDEQGAFKIAWWLISAIRVKTLAEFLVPAAADHSWSVLSGLEDKSCRAQLLEDVPQALRLSEPIQIQEDDLNWAFTHIQRFGEFLEEPRFRLAVEALTTHQHLLSHRMMAASLWSGIEALVEVQSELRFRISLALAAYLETRGPQRTAMYKRVKKLYDVRSKAVHGSRLTETETAKHVVETRVLLAKMIRKMVESGEMMTEESFERVLLEE